MTDSIPTRVADLVAGDVIRLSGGRWADDHRDGIETVVTEVNTDRGWAYIETDQGNYVDDDSWPFTFVRHAGEVDETDETPGAYRPEYLDFVARISQAADDAGYCAEYDRLARAAGAPTRAEVRRLLRERDGGRYRVTIPVVVNLTVEVTSTSGDEETIKRLARAERLPGVDDSIDDYDASARSWRGLSRAAQAIVNGTVDRSYPRGNGMTIDFDQMTVEEI